MSERYAWNHHPDPATLRRDLRADRAALHHAPRPTPSRDAAECEHRAGTFRRMARVAYDWDDQARGDRWTTRALAWELFRETGDVTLLEERL